MRYIRVGYKYQIEHPCMHTHSVMENIDDQVLQQLVLSFSEVDSLYNWAWSCGLQHHPTVQYRINQLYYYFSQQNSTFNDQHTTRQHANNGHYSPNGSSLNHFASTSTSNSSYAQNVAAYVSIFII